MENESRFKVLTKWVNAVLTSNSQPMQVKDIITEVDDGIILCALMKCLSGMKIKIHKDPKEHFQKSYNCKMVVNFLYQQGVQLEDLDPCGIQDHKPEAIEQVLWEIAKLYQLKGSEDDIIQWTNSISAGKPKDILASWRDERFFATLVDSLQLPNSTSFQKDLTLHLRNAYEYCAEHLGIPQLLDPNDSPDLRSIVLYLSYLRNYVIQNNISSKTENSVHRGLHLTETFKKFKKLVVSSEQVTSNATPSVLMTKQEQTPTYSQETQVVANNQQRLPTKNQELQLPSIETKDELPKKISDAKVPNQTEKSAENALKSQEPPKLASRHRTKTPRTPRLDSPSHTTESATNKQSTPKSKSSPKEPSDNYEFICDRISSFTQQLVQIDALQNVELIRREIEEHFERCIHILEVRRDSLIQQLEDLARKNSKPISNAKAELKDSIIKLREIQKAGGYFYDTDKNTAEHFWQAARNLKLPTVDVKALKIDIQANLPVEFMEVLENYGTVEVKRQRSSSSTRVSNQNVSRTASEPLFRGDENTNKATAATTKLYTSLTSLPFTPVNYPLLSKAKNVSTLSSSQFNNPVGICFNPNYDCLHICDRRNNLIRNLTLQGATPYAQHVLDPYGIAVFFAENILYVTNSKVGTVTSITAEGVMKTFASIKDSFLAGIAVDQITGNVFVSDSRNHHIYLINPEGKPEKLAGSEKGFQDGNWESAKFNWPEGLYFDDDSNSLLVCDANNNKIRRISMNGEVSTVCSIPDPRFITIAPDKTLFVTSDTNLIFGAIPQASGEYSVGILAGDRQKRRNDGKAGESSFNEPLGIAVHENSCFVVGSGSSSIRVISL